ncbi:ATPase with chaperone activity [Limnohabitans radicicola]|uniref:ATPase with chaperone activity n=1 Tax=Limnohabitans radicicola TaxID=2771427 RepID=A0A927FGD1_9BURK|nr:ATPase with chaperone activity [Limnohabitans radicicola]MBD8050521.1 ATPase with chaperone activity [Limnohabitans radicicola]
MSDDNQIYLPESFTTLYVPPGKIKPSIGQREMAERYELCEDLANLLTEKAANMQFTLGITEELVLAQCELGLLAEPAVVSPMEARWVVCRLGELLNWPIDQLLQNPATQDPVA